MSKPIMLDLFCGAGGAGMGYARAGFEVIGIDLVDQPNYPFRFIRRNVFEMRWDDTLFMLADAVHTSPPCQAHSKLKHVRPGIERVDVLARTRKLLQKATARKHAPWIIENVPGAVMPGRITLCGEMFGLRVIRHRWFEAGNMPTLVAPQHIPHRGSTNFQRAKNDRQKHYYAGVYGRGGGRGCRMEDWQRAMKIYWMTKPELAQAIPPAYTEYVGDQVMKAILNA